ncbi:MAG: arabinan endo-1,5-alpha-L-arabinosidase [Limisphaerales bacterium]
MNTYRFSSRVCLICLGPHAVRVIVSVLVGIGISTGAVGKAVGGERTVMAGSSPAGPAPLRVHDPSAILRCGDEYWFFSTGSGVVSRRSRDLLSWTAGPPVFDTIPAWIGEFLPGHRGHLWAPDLVRLKDRYLVYYSVSTWGRNTSAIAVASNPTLDPADPAFRWTDEGVVLRSQASDDFNAIDPAVFLDHDGRLWMALGSFWSGIKLVELDALTGRRGDPASPVIPLATHPQIEAPALMTHGGRYFLFVNWGFCCRGTNSSYEIRMGRGDRITGPYRDREGRDLLEGGGSLFLASEADQIGPGHVALVEDGTGSRWSYHYYDAERRGVPRLGLRSIEWDDEGWPMAGRRMEIPP